jgi:hypothetical protein
VHACEESKLDKVALMIMWWMSTGVARRHFNGDIDKNFTKSPGMVAAPEILSLAVLIIDIYCLPFSSKLGSRARFSFSFSFYPRDNTDHFTNQGRALDYIDWTCN